MLYLVCSNEIDDFKNPQKGYFAITDNDHKARDLGEKFYRLYQEEGEDWRSIYIYEINGDKYTEVDFGCVPEPEFQWMNIGTYGCPWR